MLTGKMIRTARKNVGESQTEFAKRFGVDQSAVSDWERKGPPNRGAARHAIEREIELIRGQNPRRVSRETSARGLRT